MSNFYKIATPLIQRGLSVIPVKPKSKEPLLGVTSRTWDLRVVEEWDRKWPDANVGICADTDIIILESDDYDRLEEMIVAGTGKYIPGTLAACGSSEKRPHLFFGRTKKSNELGNCVVPGLVECRFNNQYVVGPGSVHPSGAVYRWLNDLSIVPIPDWLVAELGRLAQAAKGQQSNPRNITITGGKVAEGSRHYYIMSELGKYWTGIQSFDDMFYKAEELNSQCDPPKPEGHIIQCVRDIMKREPNDPGPPVGPVGEKKSPGRWVSKSVSELLAMSIDAREVILEENNSPVFYGRSVNQILAWRGVGKTNFALGLAGAIASGGQILDFKAPKPRKVLYIDGELPLYQLQERARLLGLAGNIQLFGPEMLESPSAIDLIASTNQLKELMERNGTEVLFIDSQSTTMSGDSNKTDFQEAHSRLLRDLRWGGTCIIEMHHVGKSGLQRGLSRNDDILDVQIMLEQVEDWQPGDGLKFEFKYEKVRHASKLESGYIVKLTQEDGWVKGVADEVHAAAELFNKGKTEREVAKELSISTGKAHTLKMKAIKSKLINGPIEVNIRS